MTTVYKDFVFPGKIEEYESILQETEVTAAGPLYSFWGNYDSSAQVLLIFQTSAETFGFMARDLLEEGWGYAHSPECPCGHPVHDEPQPAFPVGTVHQFLWRP